MRAVPLILLLTATAGCTFRPIETMETGPMTRIERAEDARVRDARSHPDCRDSRADRDDQNDVCDQVGRAD